MRSFVLRGTISEVICILKWWQIIKCADYVLEVNNERNGI